MKKVASLFFMLTITILMLFTLGITCFAAKTESKLETSIEIFKNSNDSIYIKWSECKSADYYLLYRKSGDGKFKNIAKVEKGRSYRDKTAKAGKKYTYALRAVQGKKTGAYAKATIIRLENPVLSKTQNVKNGLKITWEKSAGAKNYRIYRKPSESGEWKRIATVKKGETTYTDKKAKSGNTYIYTVRAVNGSSISSYDAGGLSLMHLERPTITDIDSLDKGIRIKWGKVNGTEKYSVYRSSKNEKQKRIALVTKGCTYYDTTAKKGVTYKYTVKAFGGKSKSALSSAESYKYIPAIKLTDAKNVTQGISVSWSKSEYATGYRIYRKSAQDSKWKKIATVKGKNNKSYTDKNVTDGKIYYYSVAVISGDCISKYDKSGLPVKYVAAPKGVTAKISGKSNLISWKKTPSATKYYVYRKADNGNWTKIKETSALKYTDTKIKSNVTYSYRVKATVKEKYFSGYSAAVKSSRIDPSKKMVALTYDDGPSSSVTNRILDVLQKYDAKATFFVIGSRVDTYSASLVRAYKLGCEIGNHTYTHINLPSYSNSEILNEVNKTNAVIKKYTGENPTIIRAPGGATSERVRNTVKMPFIYWSVDTRDWEHRTASKTVSAIKNNVRDGSIILMHDIYSATASASETVIPWLIGQGYQLVTVSELMEYRGKKMSAGNTYYNAYK